ncbi:MAG: bifunctional oligoribonuclease/PAP phosphatase NrnA [Calditrichia bacterium]|nr:bifunctional oligoribonuclease/PAP phosphatase NrnA [Calditrichia bacterium]
MRAKIRKILNFIENTDNLLITCHQNADGDALASVLATAYLLEYWEKSYQIIIHDDSIDHKYHFLWGIEKIKSYDPDIEAKIETAIVLDVPNIERIGKPAVLLPGKNNCIKIDHHPIEEEFADLSIADPAASSTSQIIFDIIEESSIPLSPDLAQIIFTGIMYDTGRFSFSNTRKRDFEIAAILSEYDVKPSLIANQLFFNNSFESMKILGYALKYLQVFLGGNLSIIFLPYKVMKGNTQAEVEELANYSVAIRGVEVGLFIREIEPEFYKVSLRSKGRVNVNTIAKLFGGGGHDHAAGARYKGSFEELKNKMIREVGKLLNHSK